MRESRVIGVIILILQIGSFTAFMLSGYTIYQVLSSSMPQTGAGEPLKIERRGDIAEMVLTISPINRGYLPVNLSLSLDAKILGVLIASDDAKLTLTPGSREDIVLTLVVGAEQVKEIFNKEGSIELNLSARTLGNLVAFSLDAHVEGGAAQ